MSPRKGTTKTKGHPVKGAPSVVRDKRGRFSKAPRVIPTKAKSKPAPKPRTVKEVYKGRALYRGTDGKFTSKPRKAPPEAIGHGKRRRIVKPLDTVAKPVKAPRGTSKAIKYGLHGQSAPRLIEDNALGDRPTFARWKGKMYELAPQDAGNMADLLRVLMSSYVDNFAGVLESPQFEVGLLETDEGDVLDFDAMETMDPELADEFADMGDEAIEEATMDFNERAADLLDAVFHQRTRPPHAKAPKTKGKPGKRPRTSSRPGRKRKGR